MDDKHNGQLQTYIGLGVDFFHKDCRLDFTRSVAKIEHFNAEYRRLFLSFYEQISEDNVCDATCDAEYDALIVKEFNTISELRKVARMTTIILYTDDVCRYIIEGTNTIMTHKFLKKRTENMWC